MPSFDYRAITPEGQRHQGQEDARSRADLKRRLGDRGLLLVSSEKAVSKRRMRFASIRRRTDVARAVQYLATLLEAGFTLDRALTTTAKFATRADVADALTVVRDGIREGQSLASCLDAHPELFPRIAVGLVRAGERGGHLTEAMRHLATYLERQRALRARLMAALTYPCVMLLAGVASILVLVLYVLPRFTQMLAEAGFSLPWSTRILLEGSGLVASWWPVLALGIVAVLWAGRTYLGSESGRARIHRLLLVTPVVGSLRRRRVAVHLGRTLGALLTQGVPALTTLSIATETLPDRAVADDLADAQQELRAGKSVGAALASCRGMPETFLEMVHVGEEGGRLAEFLKRAADLAEDELEARLDRLTRLVEPAVIVLFGGVVGFIALSLLQAVYTVHSAGVGG